MWMSALSVHPEHFDHEIPSWDPFWSGILTFLCPADLALRRCHGTLVLDGLVYSLVLTVLYLADRSRTMNLLYGLTGSLVLAVLYLADRREIMDLL